MRKSTKDLLLMAGAAASAYALYEAVMNKSTAAPAVSGLGAAYDSSGGYSGGGGWTSPPADDGSSWGGDDGAGGWISPPADGGGASGGGYGGGGGWTSPPADNGPSWGGDPYYGQNQRHGGHSAGHPWWRWRQRQTGYNGVQQSNYNPDAWWSGGNPFVPSPNDQSTTFGTPYGDYYDNYDAYTIEQPGSLLATAAEYD